MSRSTHSEGVIAINLLYIISYPPPPPRNYSSNEEYLRDRPQHGDKCVADRARQQWQPCQQLIRHTVFSFVLLCLVPFFILVHDVQANSPPTVTGPTTVDYPENGEGPVATYTATDPEGEAIAWSVSGTDHALFSITAGVLEFLVPPNYENPVDGDGDNAYQLEVVATDPAGATAMITVTTTVTDVNDPNIVLVMADEGGHEIFGAYGSTQYRTPRIDEIVAAGVRFTNAYSKPGSTPSRVALMTGKSNVRNYVDWGTLLPGEYTIADLFGDAGYATAIAGKWQLQGRPTYLTGVAANESGFDTYCLWYSDILDRRYWRPSFERDGGASIGGTPESKVSHLHGETIHGDKGMPTDGGTHVPLIVRVPGAAGGQVVDDLIDFTDFLPTLADAVGLTIPENVTLDGTSFWDQLQGGSGNPREWIYTYYFPEPYTERFVFPREHPEVAYVRNKRYKLYASGDLYDPSVDRHEVHPLPEYDRMSYADRVKLQAALDAMPEQGQEIDWDHVLPLPPATDPRPRWHPVLKLATVNGAELTLAYVETLDTNANPGTDAFSVEVDGIGRVVTAVSLTEEEVTLASAVTVGQTVSYSYTRPATKPLRRKYESTGNKAAALTDEPVRNDTRSAPPVNVAAYSITDRRLEVRWSSFDFAGITGFKVQWKSGTEDWDASRQGLADPAASLVPASSTATSRRYKHTITRLTNGTEYTVRVIATNTAGDSDPSPGATGMPASTLGRARTFIKNEVVDIHGSTFRWLDETWDYLTDQNVPMIFNDTSGGNIVLNCEALHTGYQACAVREVQIGRNSSNVIHVITHELGHVYTLANGVTNRPIPLAIAHGYFSKVKVLEGHCDSEELYADMLMILVHGDDAIQRSPYWSRCTGTDDNLTEAALAVVRSAVAGEMPQWFADTYHDEDGKPDLERLWDDLKTRFSRRSHLVAIVYQLRNAFGGYCSSRNARDSAFEDGPTRNPWRDGGCVPEAPGDLDVTAIGDGKLSVSWEAPSYDGGAPIEGYKMQWKSGSEDFDPSRQAEVTDLANLSHTISVLTDGVAYTVRVLAYNTNGDGAASDEATVTVIDNDDPQVSVFFNPTSYTAIEGGSAVTVTVKLNADPERTVEIPLVATNQGGATDADYSGLSASVWFTRGDQEQTFTVTAEDDAVDDDGESVRLGFGALPDRVVGGGSATVTLTDNDERGVTVSPTELSVTEGGNKLYTMVLKSEPTGPVNITVYVPLDSGVSVDEEALRFTVDNWQIQQSVLVSAEADEDAVMPSKVTLMHTVTGGDYAGVLADAVTVTIIETDTPTLTIENGQAEEGDGLMAFTVRLSAASSGEVRVDYATQSVTATEETDYTRTSGTLTFPANSTTPQEIRVPITDDTEDEPDETFTVQLSNAQNAALGIARATGTINDNDGTGPPPPPPPPPPPDAPVVTRALATSMVVNWQAPDGSVISSYDLRYREGNTGDFTDGPQDIIGTRTIILGLSPDTEYEIQVRASNSTGDGDWSELGTVRTSTPIPNDRFSLALDMDDSEGDQFTSFLGVSPDGGSASIQIFGRSLKAIQDVNDLSVRFEYDATQVVYEGFKRGPVLSGTSALSGKGFVNIGMTLSDSETRDDSGLMGTLRFRAMDAITETEIRLVRVKLLQGGQSETLPMFLSVALQGFSVVLPVGEPSADFDGNGTVDIPDFLLFVDVFGLTAGQEGYETKYDLNGNDTIGIPDFLIFVDSFGKVMKRVLAFTSVPPVMRFVEENTPSGQPIGDPISASGADGDTLTYSLWGIDADYFAIDASTGHLQTKEMYNFEQRNWYSPIVRVSDGKGGQVSVVVSIAIIDIAE